MLNEEHFADAEVIAFFDASWTSRIQKHHDYYVILKRTGKLQGADQHHYDLAMERERRGEVKSLRERS